MSREVCPTCGQPLPSGAYLTPRELELLTAWWLTNSVRKAADQLGMQEQTAKNLLARARIRNGVSSNQTLLSAHIDGVRSAVLAATQHNNPDGN